VHKKSNSKSSGPAARREQVRMGRQPNRFGANFLVNGSRFLYGVSAQKRNQSDRVGVPALRNSRSRQRVTTAPVAADSLRPWPEPKSTISERMPCGSELKRDDAKLLIWQIQLLPQQAVIFHPR
jgi:hypothetical protein